VPNGSASQRQARVPVLGWAIFRGVFK